MPVQEIQRSEAAPTETSPVPKPVIAFFAALRKIFGRAEDGRHTLHEPPATAHIGAWKVDLRVEPDPLDGGFIAECTSLPGAMAQGETQEEALENLIDAVQGIIAVKMAEHYKTLGLEMPEWADPQTGLSRKS
jgi:predicted RNase H-like HicB family nuclease